MGKEETRDYKVNINIVYMHDILGTIVGKHTLIVEARDEEEAEAKAMNLMFDNTKYEIGNVEASQWTER